MPDIEFSRDPSARLITTEYMRMNSHTGGYIQTVTGPVAPSELGFTLPHEHLYIQLWDIPGRYDGARQLEDDDVFVDEILAFKRQGGTCIVELTLPAIGRKPEKLRKLSRQTDVWIVMGCGWYREPYYPPEDVIERRSVGLLTEQLVDEIRNGVNQSGIRPGIIGEIGVDRSWVAPIEERVHRAAARAQRITGLPLNLHSVNSDVALEQLTVLEEEGADLNKVAVSHCDTYPHLSYHLSLIERGAYVSFDNLGTQAGSHEQRIIDLVCKLVELGHASHLLLSHDVYKIPQLRYHGGSGFTYLSESFLPQLHTRGVSDEIIRLICEDNPRRLLTISD